jgi:Na+/proline symporter
MSTFSATINAGAAYIVNDIYKGYINKNASNKTYVTMSFIFTVVVVIVGILFGLMTDSINQWVMWIVAGLYGGYVAPNVLKWHWWRLNGFGYFAGMISGIIASMLMPLAAKLVTNYAASAYGDSVPQAMSLCLKILNNAIYAFPILLAISLAASVITSLLTRPETDETLKSFYKQIRPWGFWKPVRDKVLAEDPNFLPNKDFKRDMVNVVIGIIWQLTFTLAPIYFLIRNNRALGITLMVMAVTTIFLKFNWYDNLEKD